MTPLQAMKNLAAIESAKIAHRSGTDGKSAEATAKYAARRRRIADTLEGETFRFGRLVKDFDLAPSVANRILEDIGATRIAHGTYFLAPKELTFKSRRAA